LIGGFGDRVLLKCYFFCWSLVTVVRFDTELNYLLHKF